jgi:hypothetical protein
MPGECPEGEGWWLSVVVEVFRAATGNRVDVFDEKNDVTSSV